MKAAFRESRLHVSPDRRIPLLERSVVRPSYHLLAAPDPFNPNRAALVWANIPPARVWIYRSN